MYNRAAYRFGEAAILNESVYGVCYSSFVFSSVLFSAALSFSNSSAALRKISIPYCSASALTVISLGSSPKAASCLLSFTLLTTPITVLVSDMIIRRRGKKTTTANTHGMASIFASHFKKPMRATVTPKISFSPVLYASSRSDASPFVAKTSPPSERSISTKKLFFFVRLHALAVHQRHGD